MNFRFQRKYLCIPYLAFLILFVIIPIFIIIYYAFTDANGFFSMDAFVDFFTSPVKVNVLLVSIFIGIQTTLICLLIGYPLSYFLANRKFNKNVVLVMLFVMPMWINFVLRTGATRDVLFWLGINGGRYPYLATLIGMVYNFLPFVILPLYTTMLKIDQSQVEAALDLGASPMRAFFKAVVPQTTPGIVSAAMMVFMPTMSSYVISDTLSEGKISLFGNTIYLNFSNSQWNTGSFMALIMLVIIGILMFVTRNTNVKAEDRARGTGLW